MSNTEEYMSVVKQLTKDNLSIKGIKTNTDDMLKLADTIMQINDLIPTNVNLVIDKSIINIGVDEAINVTIFATDYGNNVLKNFDIEILVNDKVIYKDKTNENGILNYKFSFNELGTVKLSAKILEKGYYQSSISNTQLITVIGSLETNINITADQTDLNILNNNISNVLIDVKDNNNNPVKNISVQLKNKNTNNIITTLTTDNAGKVIYKYKSNKVEDINIIGCVLSNTYYQSSISNTILISTKKEQPISSITLKNLTNNYIGAAITLSGNSTSSGLIYYYDNDIEMGKSFNNESLTIEGLDVGNHSYCIKTKENNNYLKSISNNINIDIKKYPAILSVTQDKTAIHLGKDPITLDIKAYGNIKIKSGRKIILESDNNASYTFVPTKLNTSFEISCTGDVLHESKTIKYNATIINKRGE